MMELLNLSIQPVVLPFTILFGVVVLYWCTVIIGIFDVEVLDGAFELDLDVDVDLDADLNSGGGHGLFHSFVSFFGVGDLPVIIPLTILIASMWASAVLLNYYFNPEMAGLLGMGIFAGSIVIGLLIAKLLSAPFIPIYRKLNHNPEDELRAEGQVCTIVSGTLDDGIGQAEVLTNGAPLLLTVRRASGPVLSKGDEAVVLTRDPHRDVYDIRKLDAE